MRRSRDDDSGVATVVGAILILAVIVTALTSIRTQFVPQWDAQAEAAHAHVLQTQLGALQSALALETVANAYAGFTQTISMSSDRVSVFARADPPDRLEFIPGVRNLTAAAPSLTIQNVDGTSVVTAVESWQTIVGTQTIPNVLQVANLRVKLSSVSSSNNGNSITILVKDASGAVKGNFTVSVENASGPDYYIWFTTKDANGVVVYRQPATYFNSATFSPFFVDALAASYRFAAVLQAAPTPYSLEFSSHGFSGATFAITYRGVTNGGQQVWVGGGAQQVTNWLGAWNGGALRFTADHTATEDQTWVLENGALVLAQRDGAVFRIPPALGVAKVGGVTQLTLNLPTLTGTAASFLTNDPVTVMTRTMAQRPMVGIGSQITLTIPTDYVALWQSFLRSQLTAAGLTEGSHFSFPVAQQTTKQAQLVLNGTGAAGVDDVQFNLLQADVNVQLQP